MSDKILDASFRDPAGFMFTRKRKLFRQVNNSYKPHYDLLMDSGLYAALIKSGLLIEHTESDEPPHTGESYKVIMPQLVRYVSYPYEWSFSQLKDAASATLKVQQLALQYGMSLKDASAFNIQFVNGKPVLIDTLSFEKLPEGQPWIAYRQFCQHFLGPLALMAHRDVRLRHLLKSFIDGIPLDLVSSLLPSRTNLNYSLLSHIHLHARSQSRHHDDAADSRPPKAPRMSVTMLSALITSLENAINKLRLASFTTEWGGYYNATNYSDSAMAHKENLIAAWLEKHLGPDDLVHDLGANTGRFSHIVARTGNPVIAHDIDEVAVERNYLYVRENQIGGVLPLLLDLTNPTPAIGWRSSERFSFKERVTGDFMMALALIHHLAISNNVPLEDVALFFSEISNKLIIEFVPKSDSQVQRLLATREDIFHEYNVEGFEKAFSRHFDIVDKEPIDQTDRVLYFMQRKKC